MVVFLWLSFDDMVSLYELWTRNQSSQLLYINFIDKVNLITVDVTFKA